MKDGNPIVAHPGTWIVVGLSPVEEDNFTIFTR